MTTRESPLEQNGLPTMVNNIMPVVSTKSQPAFMGSYLTISQSGSPVYLAVVEVRLCVLWPFAIGLMVVLLTFF